MEKSESEIKVREEVMGLFSPVLTTREVDEVLARLHQVKGAIYQEQGAKAALKDNLKAEEYARLESYSTQAGLDLNSTTQIEKLLNAWEVELQSWPILKIILARSKSTKELDKLKTYFAQNWAKEVPFRLNIVNDSSLIGGIIVEWQGRVFDKSWKDKTGEVVQEALRIRAEDN